MATIEEACKHRDGKHGSKGGSSDLPHGRKGHTEAMAEKQDYSEKGGRGHGKVDKDCY